MSAESETPKVGKRRRWGWLFVVLFFLQAFYFTNAMNSANNRSISATTQAMVYNISRLYDSAANARRQAEMAGVLLAIGSVVCIVGALLGFRRRKIR